MRSNMGLFHNINNRNDSGFGWAGLTLDISTINREQLKGGIEQHPRAFIVRGSEGQFLMRKRQLGVGDCRGIWHNMQELQMGGTGWYFVCKGFDVGTMRYVAFTVPDRSENEPSISELSTFVITRMYNRVVALKQKKHDIKEQLRKCKMASRGGDRGGGHCCCRHCCGCCCNDCDDDDDDCGDCAQPKDGCSSRGSRSRQVKSKQESKCLNPTPSQKPPGKMRVYVLHCGSLFSDAFSDLTLAT